jgi:transcriptional regulator with GAF, ATPase, and Fis domain
VALASNGGGAISSSAAPVGRSMAEVERRHIREVLEGTGGKISGAGGAAEVLGLHPNTLRYRMQKLGLTTRRRTRS